MFHLLLFIMSFYEREIAVRHPVIKLVCDSWGFDVVA
jgi:hypothetical protein